MRPRRPAALLREPLLHFLLLGAVLFGAYAWVNRGAPSAAGARQVHIGEGDVRWLKETWAKQWQREPTRDELRGLVTEYLKEELLAREAREMGLDRDDVFVRRRLAQKVEFLVQDTSRLAEPTEDELRKFYSAYPERFCDEPRVSFTQVYFTRDHGSEVGAALARLRDSADPATIGDRLMVDAEQRDASRKAVTAQFGARFADAVFALPTGSWQGPIESGYGIHLVRVSGKTPARTRPFADVRARVSEDWLQARQREDNEKFFAGLLKKYDVVVDEAVRPLVGPLSETGSVR